MVTHHAPYARIVDGNKAQFDYVAQEGDSDPDGFTAPDPAIVHNRGYYTMAEVHDRIASFVPAKRFHTYLMRQTGHEVNVE